MGAIEVYRIYTYNLRIEDEIRLIALDAMESSMKDEYKNNHIAYLDKKTCRDNFDKHFTKQFNLNSNYKPINSNSMYKEFKVISLKIHEGSYDYPNIQTSKPYLEMKLKTSMKPIMFSSVSVPLKINCKVEYENLN